MAAGPMHDPIPAAIPADVRSRLRGLRLTSRRAGGLRGIGVHASRDRGAGIEFAQYRAYEPGDEPRSIDWKLFARSDRTFVREAERDAPLTAWIVIDASASMRQADTARPGWSRLAAAKVLAACVAELALAGGDRFGWIVLAGSGVTLVAPAGGRRQRDRLRVKLGPIAAGGGFPDEARLAPATARIARNDLVVVLSDLFDDACIALVARLAAAGREVATIQLLTAEERDFPFAGGRVFVDPETGAVVPGDGAAMRAGFVARFAAAQAALAARLATAGVRHAVHVLDEPLDAPLRTVFGPAA